MAFPNPCNPRTRIAFELVRPARVRLGIFRPDGRHLVTLFQGALGTGPQALPWDGTDAGGRTVASGVYCYRLQGDTFTVTGKLVLAR